MPDRPDQPAQPAQPDPPGEPDRSGDPRRLLRRLPQVDRLLGSEELAPLLRDHSRPLLLGELRILLDDLREAARAGRAGASELEPGAIRDQLAARLAERARPLYRRVINATGVILHTGLGRAPLPAEVAERVGELARHPQRLEIELESGERGGRDRGCAERLVRLTGAEAATVVNNNAAATLLILAALARGRRAVVSRGEMVEIGGSYRIPDVMEESGAVLTGVGTTNRTHPGDYRRAIERAAVDRPAGDGGPHGPVAGLLLKVHTSNYRVVGFTREVDLPELVEIGREHGLPVVHDLGSGCMVDLAGRGLPGEHRVRESVAAGADLVCFSGDKLLGGPQAGLIVGKAEAVERCRRHPLFRALRPGRMIYTALEATLQIYEAGEEEAFRRIPALARLTAEPVELEERAKRWARRWVERWSEREELDAMGFAAASCASQAGSGSLPAHDVESWAVEVTPSGDRTAEELAHALRTGDPAILPRIRDGAVVLDLRTLDDAEMEEIGERLAAIAAC